jgi:hypothetical protein
MTTVETAVQSLLDAFMQTVRRSSRNDIQPPDTAANGRVEASIRYWGDWQMPDGEEDDGDFDWKVLSAAALVASVQARFPTVQLSFSPEEKEWIVLSGRSIGQ